MKRLNPLEERLVSIRIPFMTLYKKGAGGQLEMKGSVVNVPVDVVPTLNKLPRLPSDAHTIMLKFKRKMTFRRNEWAQNIRPRIVLKAFDELKDSSLYRIHNVENNSENWARIINEIQNGIEVDILNDENVSTETENATHTSSATDNEQNTQECAQSSSKSMKKLDEGIDPLMPILQKESDVNYDKGDEEDSNNNG